MKTYSFTDEAVEDLDGIIEYSLNTWGQAQSRVYIHELEELCLTLVDNPLLGLPCPELAAGLYAFPYRSHTLYYSLADKHLMIVRILHTRMNVTEQL